MRVCLVSREVRPFVGGGLATYVQEMARVLVSRGHEVHVLTVPTENLTVRLHEVIPGVVAHEVVIHRGHAAIPGAYYSHANRYSMAVFEKLRELHAHTPFDYIEFPEYAGEGYWSLRAKRTLGDFAGCVLGVRLHTPHYTCLEVDRKHTLPTENAHIEHMEKWSIREADVVLSASQAMVDRVTRDLGGMKRGEERGPTRIVRLPIDLEQIRRDFGRGEAEAGSVPTIVCVGRSQCCKGSQVLVEAAHLLFERGVEACVKFIGGDTHTGPFGRSMREHLERRMSGRFRDRFTIEEARDREGLGAAIRGTIADGGVCCFPSLWESYCLACVEAMGVGACVVTSDAGALPEVVRDGVDGIVTRADDPASLADGLERAIRDRELRTRLMVSARERAVSLSGIESVGAALERVIEECRGGRGTNGGGERVAARPRLERLPSATVIVPFYNVAEFLPATLESLANQTHKDFELIIVNDGSTDADAISLLDQLRAQGYRIIDKRNGGLGSARNVGFRAASGEWVLPVDADDLCVPEYVETLLRVVSRDPHLAWASSMFTSFYTNPEEVVSGYIPLAGDPDLLPYHNIGGPGAGSILQRQTVLDVGGYDEWLTSFEDWDLWCTLVEHGHRGVAIPEFLLKYRLRQGSLIRSEVLPRQQALRAYLMKKHARLARDPSIAARMILWDQFAAQDRVGALEMQVRELQVRLAEASGTAHLPAEVAPTPPLTSVIDPVLVRSEAFSLIRENIRYRIADRINDAIKATGVHSAVKKAAVKAIGAVKKRK
ncbi:MAG: glycosyltransferase [Phycisphaerales bacterium]|nr:MAG: glycosyltransferase [Phycisphaerales bacterium]